MRSTSSLLAAAFVGVSILFLMVCLFAGSTESSTASDLQSYSAIESSASFHEDTATLEHSTLRVNHTPGEESRIVDYNGETSGGYLIMPSEELSAQICTLEMTRHIGVQPLATLVILFLMWFYTLFIAVNRTFVFARTNWKSRRFNSKLARAVDNGRLLEVAHTSAKYERSHRALVVSAGLRELLPRKPGECFTATDIEMAKLAMRRAAAVKSVELRHRLVGLRIIASSAVLLGLLSTTLGLVNVMESARCAESAGIGAVAGGIAEALLMTGMGLFVSVPAAWCHSRFSNRINVFESEMEQSSSDVIVAAIRHHLPRSGE